MTRGKMSGRRKMTSVKKKYIWLIPKRLIRLLLSEDCTLYPSIYNTRIVLNNTELTIVGVALLLKTSNPTPCTLSPVPHGAPVSFVKLIKFSRLNIVTVIGFCSVFAFPIYDLQRIFRLFQFWIVLMPV